ncbi:MAG TPA: fibronectin type III domain-containing protein [Phycisphaerales bacterium]|nr:fibronectin type III domain-containing protein [Phycisphaerales bacterium]
MPTTIAELLQWAGSHRDLWVLNQAQIGLSAPQVQAFKTVADAFIAAEAAAVKAREAAKAATLELNDAMAAVRTLGGGYINLIRAYAETTNNNQVYVLSGVDPVSPPGPQPIPNAPTNFSATVTPEGWIVVSWKASQPASGVQYRVQRRINGEANFTLVGTVGSVKKYEDKTLPFGVDRVDYIVTPVRNNIVGPSGNTFSLQFGVGGGGNFAITNATETKLAA